MELDDVEIAKFMSLETERVANITTFKSREGLGGQSIAVPASLPSPMNHVQQTHSAQNLQNLTENHGENTLTKSTTLATLAVSDSNHHIHRYQALTSLGTTHTASHRGSSLGKQRSRTLSARNVPLDASFSQKPHGPHHLLQHSNNVEFSSELMNSHDAHGQLMPNEEIELAQALMYPQYESNSMHRHEDEGIDSHLGNVGNVGNVTKQYWQQYYGQQAPQQYHVPLQDELAFDLSHGHTHGHGQGQVHGQRGLMLSDHSTYDDSKIECITEEEVQLEALIGRGHTSKVFRVCYDRYSV